MNPRGWRRKWLHQVAWAFARTICLSCSHLQIDVEGTSAVAFCSPLQLVVAGCAPDFCCCAHPEFRYRQSAQNFASHKRAGSCSRHRAAETCERGPKGPGCSCLIMCARQKPEMWGVCHESRSAVHMFAGQWSLPLSSRCTDTIRPSVLVRLSCRLCRLVFFLQCAMPQMLRSRARLSSGSMDWMWPFCCTNIFHLVSYRLPCTCSTDPFFTEHSSRTRGAVPNMLDLRRRSSFPILLMWDDSTGDSSKLFREVS